MDNLKKKHVKKLEDHFKKNKQKEEEWVQKYHKGKNRPMAHILKEKQYEQQIQKLQDQVKQKLDTHYTPIRR